MTQNSTIYAQKAKVPATCYNCGLRINVGDPILIAKTTKHTVHAKACALYEPEPV